ncbi:SixA phosphatase family protein [Flavihumibacter profundi]|uniref:SixA phosphatase family protein n=1 Tax=Flavihumibacter profundi TaxID=2716883 RepID=UPI001CC5AB33|nr:histidine phosphatase family protein [Flavihumibacter profundi]MBZ5857501.1 histidine phosphatase family protein [Flavihumibacter profundi]
MKTLYVVRHAKSSWGDLTISDFDRELNVRGHHTAPLMAKKLLAKDISIDAFVTSTAKRAIQTATYFIKAYDRSQEELILREDLYQAPAEVYLSVVAQQSDKADSIAVFGHNPGITAFVNELTDTKIDDMPTCSIFAVEIHTDHWANFAKAKKKFLFFEKPKHG